MDTGTGTWKWRCNPCWKNGIESIFEQKEKFLEHLFEEHKQIKVDVPDEGEVSLKDRFGERVKNSDFQHGSLAEEAGETVRQRAQEYGPPEENLNHIAEMWSSYLGVDIDGWDVAAMMIEVKLARAKDGELDWDTAKDVAGYADAGWAAHQTDQ